MSESLIVLEIVGLVNARVPFRVCKVYLPEFSAHAKRCTGVQKFYQEHFRLCFHVSTSTIKLRWTCSYKFERAGVDPP
jgi:hypothetical protein